MKTIESSSNIKTCFSEMNEHIEANKDTISGEKEAKFIMNISQDAYEIKSSNLSYNKRIEFAMQCDSNSRTQLFQVQ